MRSVPVPLSNPPIEKNQDLCADCGHCLAVCSEEIGVTQQWIDKSADALFCVHYRQCAAVCLERVVRNKSHWREMVRAINDPQKIVVFSTALSVHVGLGERFEGRPGDFAEGRMVSALGGLGADYVLDVASPADLAIMEEGTEFLRRFLTGSHPLPQLTSRCPTWVKYVETFHPEWIECLSNIESPTSMQGALIKIYFTREQRIDPGRVMSVVVAPCAAKKFEVSKEELCSSGIYQDVPGPTDNGYVLAIRELAEWITESGIEFYGLSSSSFDSPMGEGSGAGTTFGNTRGVMETALCAACSVVNRKKPMDLLLKYRPIRGLDQVKETVASLGEWDVRIVAIYGTRTAEQLIGTENIDSHDFVEVMICPGGHVSGGGQLDNGVLPIPDRLRMEKIKSLYRADGQRVVRSSLDNREIKRLYERFLGEPTDELAQTLPHTCYHGREGGK